EALGRHELVLEDTREVLLAFPGDARMLAARGHAAEALGRPALAIGAYVEALRHAAADDPFVEACEAALERLGYEGPRTWPLPRPPAVDKVRSFLEGLDEEGKQRLATLMQRANESLALGDGASALAAMDEAV